MSMPAISEDDIAAFLSRTPGFFERHAQLLATVQLTSPHGKRAVSLQERQLEILRDRIRGLELKLVEMIRHGQENVAIADRLHRWTRSMMLTKDPAEVPQVLVSSLQEEFLIPQATIRLWHVAPSHAREPLAHAGEGDKDVHAFVDGLEGPTCGAVGTSAVMRRMAAWCDDGETIASLALIPLRHARGTVGTLVLASPDPTRFSADMGTEFLARIGEIASAGVARLIERERS
jgi:uncharacterized protein